MTTPPTDTKVHASAYGCITMPFLLLCALFLAWGARSNWNNGQMLRDGEVVPGKIVETRHVPANPSIGSQSSRGGQALGQSAVFEFATRTGERHTATSSVNRMPPPWTVGETVDVVYDPSQPDRANLVSEVSGWRVWFAAWCAAALLAAAMASVPIVMRIRQSRAKT